MKIINTNLEDVFIIEQTKYSDSRGIFIESFNENEFLSKIGNYNFVQDNYSLSKKDVLRGLHYQINHPQGKLVCCYVGSVYDVIVDLRRSSKTFCQWFSIKLNRPELKVWIPPGFAHGFYVLENNSHFHYKTTDYYYPEDERTLLWSDKELNIDWPNNRNVILSNKDKKGCQLLNAAKYN